MVKAKPFTVFENNKLALRCVEFTIYLTLSGSIYKLYFILHLGQFSVIQDNFKFRNMFFELV